MESERLYSIQGQSFVVGKKNFIVRDPRATLAVLQSGLVYAPVVEFAKKIKDEEDPKNVVFQFFARVADRIFKPAPGQDTKTYDVRIEVPQQFTDQVMFDHEMNVAKLMGAEPACRQFIDDVNALQMAWFPLMKDRRTDNSTACTWNHPPATHLVLRWYSKTSDVSGYERAFDRVRHIHVIEFGLGYHSTKSETLGITAKLSIFPGKTPRGVELDNAENRAKNSKKRKVISLDKEGNEIVSDGSEEAKVEG